jgi:hypothetical protein
MQFPPAHTYRPALAVAFFVCFVWLVLLALGLFARLPLPTEAKLSLGLFIPLGGGIAILYRTVLYREMPPTSRMVRLFGVAFALLVCAGALLLAVSFLMFALGAIGPD